MIPARGRSGSSSATARDAQPPARPGAPPPRDRELRCLLLLLVVAGYGLAQLWPSGSPAVAGSSHGASGGSTSSDERPGRVLAAGHRPQADRHRHALGGGRHDARLRRHARAGSGQLLRRRAIADNRRHPLRQHGGHAHQPDVGQVRRELDRLLRVPGAAVVGALLQARRVHDREQRQQPRLRLLAGRPGRHGGRPRPRRPRPHRPHARDHLPARARPDRRRSSASPATPTPARSTTTRPRVA